MSDRDRTTTTAVRCEPETFISWLKTVLDSSDGVDVHIVVEDAAESRSSVQITLRHVPGPLAGLQLRDLA